MALIFFVPHESCGRSGAIKQNKLYLSEDFGSSIEMFEEKGCRHVAHVQNLEK